MKLKLLFILATAALAGCASHASPASRPTPDVAAKPQILPVQDLPVIKRMPDPLVMLDGQKVTTIDQWRIRRIEMEEILEDYEYGHMPPPPGNVIGREISSKVLPGGQVNYRLVHLSFGRDSVLGFDVGIFAPVQTTGAQTPLPTFISLSFSSGENGVRQYQAALRRGYAVAAIGYQQLGADNPNYRSTAFFPAYPQYDWNDFSAWAWGISRCVDYLQHDPNTDATKLIVTGVSRTGQAALLAGAFDERIALVAPVAGGMALRFAGKGRGGGQGIDEVVDQNTYWFGPRFALFKGQTDRLPCDQNWLLALAAPRPFILCNALSDQYGNTNAAVQTYLGAKPVYEFLGVPDRLGINFRPGRHGMNAADWSAILDFCDQQLRNIDVHRRFDQIPSTQPAH